MTTHKTPTPSPEPSDVSEQMRVRMDKRAKLLESGVEPYPVGVDRTHTLNEVREKYGHLAADETTGETVGISG